MGYYDLVNQSGLSDRGRMEIARRFENEVQRDIKRDARRWCYWPSVGDQFGGVSKSVNADCKPWTGVGV